MDEYKGHEHGPYCEHPQPYDELLAKTCPNCFHANPHDGGGIGICRHEGCGCEDTRDLDGLVAVSLDAAKRHLLEAIKAENPLVQWLHDRPDLTPEQFKANRKMLRKWRRRRWVENHTPHLHLGPCPECEEWHG